MRFTALEIQTETAMSEVYTPGTTIRGDILIRKTRQLVLDGQVLVQKGQNVEHDTIVASAERPGKLATVRVTQQLGIEPSRIEEVALVKVGDRVEAGQNVALHKTFFGLLKWRSSSPVEGEVEFLSAVSGRMGIRQPSEPVHVRAYVPGQVVEIVENRGAVIEVRGAMVQGLFGVGGERSGTLTFLESLSSPPTPDLEGAVVLVDDAPTADWLKLAAEAGIQGVICPTMDDHELSALLGYEVGVAITGDEACGVTVVLAEGFGDMSMAPGTLELLKSLAGHRALISGATQVRAGVIRPEVLVPYTDHAPPVEVEKQPAADADSPRVRVLRAPYFGRTGRIIGSPVEPQSIETGAKVRVFIVKLDDGQEVTVPRANMEVLG